MRKGSIEQELFGVEKTCTGHEIVKVEAAEASTMSLIMIMHCGTSKQLIAYCDVANICLTLFQNHARL